MTQLYLLAAAVPRCECALQGTTGILPVVVPFIARAHPLTACVLFDLMVEILLLLVSLSFSLNSSVDTAVVLRIIVFRSFPIWWFLFLSFFSCPDSKEGQRCQIHNKKSPSTNIYFLFLSVAVLLCDHGVGGPRIDCDWLTDSTRVPVLVVAGAGPARPRRYKRTR